MCRQTQRERTGFHDRIKFEPTEFSLHPQIETGRRKRPPKRMQKQDEECVETLLIMKKSASQGSNAQGTIPADDWNSKHLSVPESSGRQRTLYGVSVAAEKESVCMEADKVGTGHLSSKRHPLDSRSLQDRKTKSLKHLARRAPPFKPRTGRRHRRSAAYVGADADRVVTNRRAVQCVLSHIRDETGGNGSRVCPKSGRRARAPC